MLCPRGCIGKLFFTDIHWMVPYWTRTIRCNPWNKESPGCFKDFLFRVHSNSCSAFTWEINLKAMLIAVEDDTNITWVTNKGIPDRMLKPETHEMEITFEGRVQVSIDFPGDVRPTCVPEYWCVRYIACIKDTSSSIGGVFIAMGLWGCGSARGSCDTGGHPANSGWPATSQPPGYKNTLYTTTSQAGCMNTCTYMTVLPYS